MKKIILYIVIVLFAGNYVNGQNYIGTIVPEVPKAGTVVTISFSLNEGDVQSDLAIYIYNSYTKTYQRLTTESTFDGLAYHSTYLVPDGTPSNTVLQFALGSVTLPVSYYGVVSPATVLPIVFKSYNASLYNTDKILLEWTLASNNGIKNTVIRRSTDGRNFTPIAIIPGDGLYYRYVDTPGAGPAYFYTIECSSLDGDIKISNTLYVTKNISLSQYRILNNGDVRNRLFISGPALSLTAGNNIKIFDIAGREYPAPLTASNTVNVERLEKGFFYLKIANQKPLAFVKK